MNFFNEWARFVYVWLNNSGNVIYVIVCKRWQTHNLVEQMLYPLWYYLNLGGLASKLSKAFFLHNPLILPTSKQILFLVHSHSSDLVRFDLLPIPGVLDEQMKLQSTLRQPRTRHA
jgi:hypothetical protein